MKSIYSVKQLFLTLSCSAALFCAPQTQASEPFVGEIIWTGFTFCPRGFADANGQILAINSNEALFSLYGTIYGGDGRTTFALPDLRGRNPVHQGHGPGLSNIGLGQRGGAETVTLSTNQIPSHHHVATLRGTSENGNVDSPAGAVQANARRSGVYSTNLINTDMGESSISVANTGGSQAHENRSPYVGLRACVALVGVYPSRN